MKFYDQLNAIHPALVLMFDRFLLSNADQMVEGYNGGQWQDVGLGVNLYALQVPSDDSGRVRLTNGNNYCDVRTDARSAGVALTILSLNQLLWWVSEKGNDALTQKVNRLWEKVQNASRSKKNQLDVPSILAFCD